MGGCVCNQECMFIAKRLIFNGILNMHILFASVHDLSCLSFILSIMLHSLTDVYVCVPMLSGIGFNHMVTPFFYTLCKMLKIKMIPFAFKKLCFKGAKAMLFEC